MKKLFFFLIFFVFLLLTACSSPPPNCLAYQCGPFSARITVSVGETGYELQIEACGKDDYRAYFYAPGPLADYCFSKKNGEYGISVGDLFIPAESALNDGLAEKAVSLLYLQKSEIKEISRVNQNGVDLDVINFKAPGGTAKMYAEHDTGFPVCIETTENGTALRIDVLSFSAAEQ